MGPVIGQKQQSTRHNTVRHDGQLVTRFYGDFTVPNEVTMLQYNIQDVDVLIMGCAVVPAQC